MPERTPEREAAAADLAAAVFSDYQRRLMELLLLEHAGSLHVREIGRRTGIPVGSLLRELQRLHAAGLLRRHRVGNQVHYEADPACPALKELTALLRKLARSGSRPRAATMSGRRVPPLERLGVSRRSLAALCRRHLVHRLSFFGSVTRPDFGRDSDVDVMVEFAPEHGATLADLVDLRDELSTLFGGRRVDVATAAILANPYRRASIQKNLQAGYAAR